MSLKLACPRCHHVQFFDDAEAGQPASCVKCEQVFRVPRPAPTEDAPAPPTPTVDVPWQSPGHLAARELPTSFAPPETLHAKAVPLPDEASPPANRKPRYLDDDEANGPNAARRPARTLAELPRPRRRPDEPTKTPWAFGISLIAFVLLLFTGTALWFVMTDHRPRQPQKNIVFQNQFGQAPAPPPMPMPQQMPPMWPGGKGVTAPIAPQGNEQFIPLKLAKGKVQVRDAVGANDPFDPLKNGCHRKVYLIDLEANRNYTIEMNQDPPKRPPFTPFDFDPFLRLEDSKGLILDEHDDIIPANIMNAKITIAIPAKGTYRIIATSFGPNQLGRFILNVRDEDMGTPVVSKKLPDLKLPTPTQRNEPLPVKNIDRRGVKITTILESDAPLLGDLCWADNGTSFFTLDEQGTLRRIAVPGFIEEKRLALGRPASSLARSSQGLLVVVSRLEEVWQIDPETLDVTKRISVPGVQRVTASPELSVAYAATRVPAKPLPKEALAVLDLDEGVAVRQYDFPPKNVTVSPDGKYVFAEGGIDLLVRYRVQGDELMADEKSARIGNQNQGIFVSPDGKFVCLSSKLGNDVNAVNPPAQVYTTFIYAADKLSAPAFMIHTGEAPRAIGFDPARKEVLASNHEKQLLIFDEAGVKKNHDVVLPGADRLANEPRQFLTQPQSGYVLIRTERAVYGIELPKEDE